MKTPALIRTLFPRPMVLSLFALSLARSVIAAEPEDLGVAFVASAAADSTFTRDGNSVPLRVDATFPVTDAEITTPPSAKSSTALLLPASGLVILVGPGTELRFNRMPPADKTGAPFGDSLEATLTLVRGSVQVVADSARENARHRVEISTPSGLVVATGPFSLSLRVYEAAATERSATLVALLSGAANVWRSAQNPKTTAPLTALGAGQQFFLVGGGAEVVAFFDNGESPIQSLPPETVNELVAATRVAVEIRNREAIASPAGSDEPLPVALDPASAVSPAFLPNR